jgi:hypothetical protein
MTKKEIKELTAEAIEHLRLAHVDMTYNENYFNLIPIRASERLFLAIVEQDFIFDGFRVSRFRDVERIRVKNNKCDEIIRSERLFENFSFPELDIASWQTVFEGLKNIGKNIIVEYETADGEDDEYTIGRITKARKDHVYIHHFDANGVWQPKPWRVPFSRITSVTFDSRYVNIFSKYIPEAPTI